MVTQKLADAVGKRLVVTHQRICEFRRQVTSMRERRFHFKTTEANAPQAAACQQRWLSPGDSKTLIESFLFKGVEDRGP